MSPETATPVKESPKENPKKNAPIEDMTKDQANEILHGLDEKTLHALALFNMSAGEKQIAAGKTEGDRAVLKTALMAANPGLNGHQIEALVTSTLDSPPSRDPDDPTVTTPSTHQNPIHMRSRQAPTREVELVSRSMVPGQIVASESSLPDGWMKVVMDTGVVEAWPKDMTNHDADLRRKVLKSVDHSWELAQPTQENPDKKLPRQLRVNRAWRRLFRNVVTWGDNCAIVLVSREDKKLLDDDVPRFSFETGDPLEMEDLSI